MRNRFAIVTICLGALVLSACASGLKFAEINPAIAPSNLDQGRIFFYRPSSLGAVLRPSVVVNGETVGEAVSWGFFYIDRPPGSYEVVTSTEVKRKVSFVLEPGQTRFVRFSTSFGFFLGHVFGELVEADQGESEIRGCKYTGVKPLPD